jgi:hypothetical protein
MSLARAVIEAGLGEYDEGRPKKSLDELTPAQFAKRLTIKVVRCRTALKPSATESGGRRAAFSESPW